MEILFDFFWPWRNGGTFNDKWPIWTWLSGGCCRCCDH